MQITPSGRVERVLHVTEAMGGGIVSFVDSITRRQAEAGAEVSVLHTVRPDTPDPATMRRRFHHDVKLLNPIDRGSTLKSTIALAREARRLATSGEYDAIHLHSSISGAACRLSLLGTKTPLFYSPHGFAFLRESSGKAVRFAYQLLERLCASKGTLIVTSNGEIELARETLHAPRIEYLQSGVPLASLPEVSRKADDSSEVLVVTTARITYQKAPWRFAAVARALRGRARFLWVGGGDPADIERWIGDAPVEMREWVTPEELEEVFKEADIFLFPTLWEGMALSLIQAQGRGLPAVTSNVVGNRDTVLDGTTGYVRTDEQGLIEATRSLIDDAELRLTMCSAAVEHVREHFTDDRIGTDSLEIYARHGVVRS